MYFSLTEPKYNEFISSFHSLFSGFFSGISPTPAYKANKGKDSVQAEFKKQCDVFKNKVDFVLGEVGSWFSL